MQLACSVREHGVGGGRRRAAATGGGTTREAEGTRLLSGRSSKGYRGFESLPLREVKKVCSLWIRTRAVSRRQKPGGSTRIVIFNEVEDYNEGYGACEASNARSA